MTLENLIDSYKNDGTVLGQTIAYARKKLRKAETPDERGQILHQVGHVINTLNGACND